jgi:diaminopimelate decarboxylase
VFAAKRMPDGRRSYVIDAGVNLLYTSTWYRYNIETDRHVQGMGEPAMLNGPLCMNIDVVDEGTLLPPLSRGTRLILSPVGAYNITQWMQFIEYRPAVVLVTEDGRMELIRERESLDDIVARERLPDRLRIDDAK